MPFMDGYETKSVVLSLLQIEARSPITRASNSKELHKLAELMLSLLARHFDLVV